MNGWKKDVALLYPMEHVVYITVKIYKWEITKKYLLTEVVVIGIFLLSCGSNIFKNLSKLYLKFLF
jgi:hypothetical protein